MLLNCGVREDSWDFLDSKEIQPVHLKGDQSWVFIGGTDVEAEAPILWPPDAKSWLTGKDPDAGKDWGQEEKGMTEDKMVGWHHWLNGHEFGWTPGVGDGQAGLACCSPWGHKEPDDLVTEQQYPVEGMKGIVWLTIWRQDLNTEMEKHMDYILQFSHRAIFKYQPELYCNLYFFLFPIYILHLT